MKANKLRVFELLLVLSIAFAGSVIASVFGLFTGSATYAPQDVSYVVYFIVSEVCVLALLFYVLLRQRRNPEDIGLAFGWKDVWWSLALFLATYAVFTTSYLTLYSIQRLLGPAESPAVVRHPVLDGGLLLLPLLAVVINPVFEELIVRG